MSYPRVTLYFLAWLDRLELLCSTKNINMAAQVRRIIIIRADRTYVLGSPIFPESHRHEDMFMIDLDKEYSKWQGGTLYSTASPVIMIIFT